MPIRRIATLHQALGTKDSSRDMASIEMIKDEIPWTCGPGATWQALNVGNKLFWSSYSNPEGPSQQEWRSSGLRWSQKVLWLVSACRTLRRALYGKGRPSQHGPEMQILLPRAIASMLRLALQFVVCLLKDGNGSESPAKSISEPMWRALTSSQSSAWNYQVMQLSKALCYTHARWRRSSNGPLS